MTDHSVLIALLGPWMLFQFERDASVGAESQLDNGFDNGLFNGGSISITDPPHRII